MLNQARDGKHGEKSLLKIRHYQGENLGGDKGGDRGKSVMWLEIIHRSNILLALENFLSFHSSCHRGQAILWDSLPRTVDAKRIQTSKHIMVAASPALCICCLKGAVHRH